MNAEIVSIGTELLLGEIVDTNSAHIARHLRDIGVNLYFTTTVGDNEGRIAEALNIALDRADIVITTGGLGPTVDDVTRQAVAQATGQPLEFRQDLLDQIAERFARFGSQMSDNNRQQAYIPAGAIPIENPVGTAPCYIVDNNRGVVISLPGVPREMKYLLDTAVLPFLRERFNLKSVIKARILRTAGIGESTIDTAITDLMTLKNPTVGLAAHIGQTDIRITALADDPVTADSMIAAVEEQIRERLGEYIYGVEKDRIEDALIASLNQAGLQIAISETGIGADLMERLTKVPGGDQVVAGTQHFDNADGLVSALSLDDTATPEDIGAAAVDHLAAALNAPLNIALIARSDATIISVKTPTRTKVRVYQFGEQDIRPSIWAGTWGLALAWHWLQK
jgi:nicotinamide-nucleotide amidase